MSEPSRPEIRIAYCTQCHWLLRAAWMAQELLSTFGTELAAVSLLPGTGGVFTVHCGDTLIWERKRDGGFPDAARLKQLVRDVIAPGRDLGHSDKNRPSYSSEETAGSTPEKDDRPAPNKKPR